MPIEIVTKEDLHEFRNLLVQDIKALLGSATEPQKEWLKSAEVRKLLKISPGTLQNLRVNGTLSYTKIGSLLYYSYADIQKLLEGGKTGTK